MTKRRRSRGVGEGSLRPTPRSDSSPALGETISGLINLDLNGLCLQWRNHLGGSPPAHLPRWLLLRILAYRIQAAALGSLDKETLRVIRQPKGQKLASSDARPFETRIPTTRDGANLRVGALLAREWNGKLERVMVLENGFAWNGETYESLSQIAKAMTGTSWNGHRFFGLRMAESHRSAMPGRTGGVCHIASLEVAPMESTQDGKVGRGAGSLSVAEGANGEMALVRAAGRRDSGKAASPCGHVSSKGGRSRKGRRPRDADLRPDRRRPCRHEASWKNAIHREQWRSTLGAAYCATIRDLPVDEVDTAAVLKVLKPIWSKTPETASRLRGRIETVLDAARVLGHIDENRANPARWRGHLDKLLPNPKKIGERGNHAAMPYQDVPAFMERLKARRPAWRPRRSGS